MDKDLMESWNNRIEYLESKIDNFIKEVKDHHNNGHKELSIAWILNFWRENYSRKTNVKSVDDMYEEWKKMLDKFIMENN